MRREIEKSTTMKSLFILVSGLFVSISCIAAAKFSDSKKPAVAYMWQNNVVKVFYKSDNTENVRISIYDDQRKKVFEETLRKVSGFSRPYNLSDLPVGTYTVKVSIAGHEISTLEHVTTESRVSYRKALPSKKVIAYVTNLRSYGKYVLSIPDRGKDHLMVRIYNERQVEIYRNELDVAGEAAFVVNLEALRGKYSMDVVTKDKIINTFQLTNQ
jgi:hypothetical protein